MNTSLSRQSQPVALFALTADLENALVECHVLLWSQSQCALHIEPASGMLQANRRAYAEDRRMDYVPLFFGERADCDSIAASVRGTLRIRQEAKPQGQTI